MKPPIPFHRLSPPDAHYFHGFYNLQPWSPGGDRFLCHRVPFADRMPTGAESAEIGWLDFPGGRFHPLAETRAWNFQLGSMLQWVDAGRVIYNTRSGGRFHARVHSIADGTHRDLPATFFALSPSGDEALGFDMSRGAVVNPGYSYHGAPPPLPTSTHAAPEDDGLLLMETGTGRSRLLIACRELASRFAGPAWRGEPVFLGRLLWSPAGRGALFSFRFWSREGNARRTALLHWTREGNTFREVTPMGWHPAHFDWCGEEHFTLWCTPEGKARQFHTFALASAPREPVPVATGKLTADGHIAWCRGGRAILCDTFRQPDGCQHLFLYEPAGDRLTRLARFPAAPGPTDLRCDLHPCLSRDEAWVSLDTFHEPFRGVMVAPMA